LKKTFWQILSSLLAFLLIFPLSACGSNQSTPELYSPLSASFSTENILHFSADTQLLLIDEQRLDITFSGGAPDAAACAQKDFTEFLNAQASLNGDSYDEFTFDAEYGLAHYLELEENTLNSTEAENYSPLYINHRYISGLSSSRSLSFEIIQRIQRTGSDEFIDIHSAINYNAQTGERLTLEDIALDNINLPLYLRDALMAYLYTYHCADLLPDADERMELFICREGFWYFDCEGLVLLCNSGVVHKSEYPIVFTIPYSELVKVVKSEFIPDTASVGTDTFASGLQGDESTFELSGRITAINGDTLIIESTESGPIKLILSDDDCKQTAAELLEHKVYIVYYQKTNKIAAIYPM